ncbi:tRNA guanosine(34) transglycosylase Tgt [Fodinicurvata sp. EGI_FJ10296]|uniref:tRNA guanosine(34) transglycosylase Tgt n=1 Tax=Fodinicurvata sp. EGI_FJ10296 TaxID=3231908 RepID=UPI0034523D78
MSEADITAPHITDDPQTAFKYDLFATDGAARRGRISTAHGPVDTPAFMPVGTAGTVKGMLPENVADTGAQIVLGNTYHLMLRPGADRVERLGGLRRMMDWKGPVLTDSGGFQVMSLAALRRMSEDGVTFQSHLDGSRHHLSPESSIGIQHALGSTITMALDECTAHPAPWATAADSMRLSMRWALRSKDAFQVRPGHALFGIVQGSVYDDLRRESAEALTAIGFDGYAIGGLAVGEGQEEMFRVLDATVGFLPADRPRYLMGVGTPADLVGAVGRGVDMFDCVMPTRSGRTGQAFTRHGKINIRNARHQDDPRPLDAACGCPACTRFSRAYLHHLNRCGEILGAILMTWHNIRYYQDIMAEMRASIEQGRFGDATAMMADGWLRGDIDRL